MFDNLKIVLCFLLLKTKNMMFLKNIFSWVFLIIFLEMFKKIII